MAKTKPAYNEYEARENALAKAIVLAQSNPNLRATHEVVCAAQEFYDFLTGKDEAAE